MLSMMATMPSVGAKSSLANRTERQVIDARGIHYRDLNTQLMALVEQGYTDFVLQNMAGQRYLGTNLQRKVRIRVEGVPGNDMGAFMDGPIIEVMNDAQDGCGNTMNSGQIIVHGSAGDILGHSMRGGEIFVRENVGYRVGIHMKEYNSPELPEPIRPVIVIGGTAQHFLGEYMGGGVLIVLGANLDEGEIHPSRYVGTGMHGGVMYIRGKVQQEFLGKEVGQRPLDDADWHLLRHYVMAYAQHFDMDADPLLQGQFLKLLPLTQRPYGQLYAY